MKYRVIDSTGCFLPQVVEAENEDAAKRVALELMTGHRPSGWDIRGSLDLLMATGLSNTRGVGGQK
jgi:hypothetical protein